MIMILMRRGKKYFILGNRNKFFLEQNLEWMGATIWNAVLRKVQKYKGKKCHGKSGVNPTGLATAICVRKWCARPPSFCLNVYFVKTNSSCVCVCKLTKKGLIKHKIYFMFIFDKLFCLFIKSCVLLIILFYSSHMNSLFWEWEPPPDITFVIYVCFLCDLSLHFLILFFFFFAFIFFRRVGLGIKKYVINELNNSYARVLICTSCTDWKIACLMTK